MKKLLLILTVLFIAVACESPALTGKEIKLSYDVTQAIVNDTIAPTQELIVHEVEYLGATYDLYVDKNKNIKFAYRTKEIVDPGLAIALFIAGFIIGFLIGYPVGKS